MGKVGVFPYGLSIILTTRCRLVRLKADGEQLDDRIVEVHWDAELSGWRMMRFRNDKPNGNHKSVVEAIIKSIADGVEKRCGTLPSSPQLPVTLHLLTYATSCPLTAAQTLKRDPELVEDETGPARGSATGPATTASPEQTAALSHTAHPAAPSGSPCAPYVVGQTGRLAGHEGAVRANCGVAVEQGVGPAYGAWDVPMTRPVCVRVFFSCLRARMGGGVWKDEVRRGSGGE